MVGGMSSPAFNASSDLRPRVLEVLFSFRVGGSELLGLELAGQLAEEGVEVLCTALDGMSGPLRERCSRLGVRVVDLGLPRKGLLSRNGMSPELTRRLRALRLDAVHLQHFLGLNKLGLAARLAGVRRVVVTEHSIKDVSQSLSGRMRVRLASGLAHAITVIHPSIKEYLVRDLGVASDRITVIPVGVDLERWRRDDRTACRAAHGIGEEFVGVFAGRLAPVKDVPGLIRAFLAAAAIANPRGRLIIVGDGPEMQACRRAADAHALASRVTFVGEQSDIRPFVAAADVFLMNSLSEGTPRALLEAMACGLPGISTAVGGVPSMLEGRGWLVAPGDTQGMVGAIKDAMSQPQQVAEYGARAKAYVRANFDAREALSLYRTLLLQGSQ